MASVRGLFNGAFSLYSSSTTWLHSTWFGYQVQGHHFPFQSSTYFLNVGVVVIARLCKTVIMSFYRTQARKQWKQWKQWCTSCSVCGFFLEQEKNQRRQEYMRFTQANQKTWYEWKSRLRIFHPGQKALLLLPTSDIKLLA